MDIDEDTDEGTDCLEWLQAETLNDLKGGARDEYEQTLDALDATVDAIVEAAVTTDPVRALNWLAARWEPSEAVLAAVQATALGRKSADARAAALRVLCLPAFLPHLDAGQVQKLVARNAGLEESTVLVRNVPAATLTFATLQAAGKGISYHDSESWKRFRQAVEGFVAERATTKEAQQLLALVELRADPDVLHRLLRALAGRHDNSTLEPVLQPYLTVQHAATRKAIEHYMAVVYDPLPKVMHAAAARWYGEGV